MQALITLHPGVFRDVAIDCIDHCFETFLHQTIARERRRKSMIGSLHFAELRIKVLGIV